MLASDFVDCPESRGGIICISFPKKSQLKCFLINPKIHNIEGVFTYSTMRRAFDSCLSLLCVILLFSGLAYPAYQDFSPNHLHPRVRIFLRGVEREG